MKELTGKWIERYLRLAQEISSWSKDPSTKCGAVIVNSTGRVIGLGYNGFPDSIEDKEEWYQEKSIKYDLVIHSELNCVLNSSESVRGCTMFVTGPPCVDCAKLIVQAGIANVFYIDPFSGNQADFAIRWKDSIERANRVFENGKVGCFGYILQQ